MWSCYFFIVISQVLTKDNVCSVSDTLTSNFNNICLTICLFKQLNITTEKGTQSICSYNTVFDFLLEKSFLLKNFNKLNEYFYPSQSFDM